MHTLIKKTWDAALVNKIGSPGQFDPLLEEVEALLAQHPNLAIEVDTEKISGHADGRLRGAIASGRKVGKFLTLRVKAQKDRVFIVTESEPTKAK